MKDLRDVFKYRLMYAVESRGKRTYNLAKKLNIHDKTLYGYYYGVFPKLQTFYNICEELNVSADYLLGRTDKMEVNK